MNKSTSTSALLGFAVIAALLTGCSSTAASPLDSIKVPAATASATEAPTEAPAAETVKTGDVVDAVEAKAVLKAGNGQRAYPMADGTFVVVTKTEPLPAAVQADAQAKATAVAVAHRDISADLNAAGAAFGQAQGVVAKNTGKRVIAVWAVVGFPTLESETKVPYFSVQGAGASKQFTARADADAYVKAFLAGSDTAGEYVVINAG